jgi:hypothetical protein
MMIRAGHETCILGDEDARKILIRKPTRRDYVGDLHTDGRKYQSRS